MSGYNIDNLGSVATALFRNWGQDTDAIAERVGHPEAVVEREMHNHMKRGKAHAKGSDRPMQGAARGHGPGH
jgi:hypothetical protein